MECWAVGCWVLNHAQNTNSAGSGLLFFPERVREAIMFRRHVGVSKGFDVLLIKGSRRVGDGRDKRGVLAVFSLFPGVGEIM